MIPNTSVEKALNSRCSCSKGEDQSHAHWGIFDPAAPIPEHLLWAARGRTPHLYRGRRWGLTIPTWAGGQECASVGLASPEGTFRYVNWAHYAAAHQLEKVGSAPRSLLEPAAKGPGCPLFP